MLPRQSSTSPRGGHQSIGPDTVVIRYDANSEGVEVSLQDFLSTKQISRLGLPAIAGLYVPMRVFDSAKDKGDLSILECVTLSGEAVVIKAVFSGNAKRHA